MYYYNNKQAQNPFYDWGYEKIWVIKMNRFGFRLKKILNFIRSNVGG